MTNRFPEWPRWAARALLTLLLLVLVYGATVVRPASPTRQVAATMVGGGDAALYGAITVRVAAGQNYWDAAVAEQSARDYPLRPFVTVRPPTLAWLTAALGMAGATLALHMLAAVAIAAFALRLRAVAPSRVEWFAAALLSTVSVATMTSATLAVWHESWAALLIMLSLGCRGGGRWRLTVLFGLAAGCFREIAAPYLLVMAVLAWRERGWPELRAWIAAIMFFIVLMAVHAAMVSRAVPDMAAASQGWTAIGGYPFVLRLVRDCTPLAALPFAVTALALPLAFLGWWSRRDGLADRVSLTLAGYGATFSIVGRPENFYWGLLITPILLAGLAFAPRGLRDLVRAGIVPPRPTIGRTGSRPSRTLMEKAS